MEEKVVLESGFRREKGDKEDRNVPGLFAIR
jgi:hypothetical protein